LAIVAASVSTRVVSWKEAAEMNDSVSRKALVMPRRIGSDSAIWPPALVDGTVGVGQQRAIDVLSPEMVGVARLGHAHLAEHAGRTMISMCLSLIATPCEAVDLLDLGR
jgi:hypothetical protein